MNWLQSFFSTPARQALGWTALGLVGIAFAAGGVWFLTDDDGGAHIADAGDSAATATATPTRTPTATPAASATASPTATATASPTAAPTARTAAIGGGGGSGNTDPQPQAPAPTPEPTTPPVVAGGAYCNIENSSSPPNSVFGLLKSGGADVPAGAAVSLAFDGVIGPTRATAAAGGYRVDYFTAGESCANRVGAAISVVYNGAFHATGQAVGGSPGGPVRFDISE